MIYLMSIQGLEQLVLLPAGLLNSEPGAESFQKKMNQLLANFTESSIYFILFPSFHERFDFPVLACKNFIDCSVNVMKTSGPAIPLQGLHGDNRWESLGVSIEMERFWKTCVGFPASSKLIFTYLLFNLFSFFPSVFEQSKWDVHPKFGWLIQLNYR